MLDSHALAEYSSQILNAPDNDELENRLGLYRVFLKLYEHHRELLNEILALEGISGRSRSRASLQYVQAVILGKQVYLITNLPKGKTACLFQVQRIWVIGRDRKAAIPIPDRRLSRRHAALKYTEGQGFHLIDLRSTNGSFVNGEPVRRAICLRDGDQVRLGSLSFTFFVCQTAQAVEAVPPEVLMEINDALSSTALTHHETGVQDSLSSTPSDWDTPLTGSSDETSMFFPASFSGMDSLTGDREAQLNRAKKGEILDRFFSRQSLS